MLELQKYITNYFLISSTLAVIILLGLFANKVVANESLKQWSNEKVKISQITPRIISVSLLSDKSKSKAEFDFDMEIYEVALNPRLPIALIATYDKQVMDESVNESGAASPIYYIDCKTFILDLESMEKYVYEESCADAIINIWSTDGSYALNGFNHKVIQAEYLVEYLKGNTDREIQISIANQNCSGFIDANSWYWISDYLLTFEGGVCGSSYRYLFNVKSQVGEAFCASSQKPNYGCNGPDETDLGQRIKEIQD